jgi:ATP phosphoribosyltransferase
MVEIKIALPKGRLLRKTAALLQRAEWGLDEYHSKMGFYRPVSSRFPDLRIRVFHEKDIPIQVAMGNYDLGICGLDWVEELLSKYPSSDLIKVKDLLYGEGSLYLAANTAAPADSCIRIASEYPNIAESTALKKRLSRFSIFPVWGAAEAYPPENADMVLLAVKAESELSGYGLKSINNVLRFSACLIANRKIWESKDMDAIVTTICDKVEKKSNPKDEIQPEISQPGTLKKLAANTLRLALPDGHQQQPTLALLNKCGIKIHDYPSEAGNHRPDIDLDGVSVKVIRPQDMPIQVANGNFDLAITGRDWLREHFDQFPSSPVKELLNLKMGKVRLVAVVSQDLSVADADGLRRFSEQREGPFRIATEYVNIADKYARDNHIGHYRVIPTWGATEAFLPEDADMLIENTETGRTIARHNLKIIDTLFESTACLIGMAEIKPNTVKSRRIDSIVTMLAAGVEVPD